MAEVVVADLVPDSDGGPPPDPPIDDVSAYVRSLGDGTSELNLAIANLHCPGCIPRIEGPLQNLSGVIEARVNLSAKRLRTRWRDGALAPERLLACLADRGFRAVPYHPETLADAGTREARALLRALAVAGFAAGNVMLLSVAVWSGLASDMGPATRALFHWVSALIAVSAVAYAGQPFFQSAVASLRNGRLNMDVPISLAVLLATGMSLFETMRGGPHVYFDAAVTLLFFLLVGRFLDVRVRGQARSTAANLLLLRAGAATVVAPDGSRRALPIDRVEPGMRVAVATGERIPVDGRVVSGRSDIDTSLVTGETLPRAVEAGGEVFAGTLNLSAPLEIRVRARDEGTLLAEIARLTEAAEQGRARYVRLADRMARVYAPVVHLLAAATFLGWLAVGGLPWQGALLIAVAVLIITCPCALGLAVPAVQVAATGRLLRAGVLTKSADGLERLAQIDTVIFDKTGTLTRGHPTLTNRDDIAEADLLRAAGLARDSRHPLARALVRAADARATVVGPVREVPGMGLSAATAAGEVRLGNRGFCGVEMAADDTHGSELWLTAPGRSPARFVFEDSLRPDADRVVARLQGLGLDVRLLSGDRTAVVADVAVRLGIETWASEQRPADKVACVEALAAEGRKVLMVGDGLNDAPALSAGFVSASPAEAADISQTAADFILQGDNLAPLLEALQVARHARRLVWQNFALAFGYNAVAVPLAVAGFVTPLVAAVAMSASSLAVTANSLRLTWMRQGRAP